MTRNEDGTMPLSPEDRLAIVETIARYCHATDSGDGVGVADQFTEDGILEITGAWQAKGRAQIEQIGNFPNKPKHWTNSIVVDGTGSTAQSTVYYAAVRGGGPLYATGRYDSRLTKQFNGQWKLVHHCYTGDPVERPAPARSADNPDLLRAADRLQIIELIARFDAALQRGDGETVGQLFTAQGTWQDGTDPVQLGIHSAAGEGLTLDDQLHYRGEWS
jgi:ketosteroid isomerase-like protein